MSEQSTSVLSEDQRPLDFAAFPGQAQFDGGTNSGDYHLGLSKRELFAGMIMQGIMNWREDSANLTYEQCAGFAVQAADALLKELARG